MNSKRNPLLFMFAFLLSSLLAAPIWADETQNGEAPVASPAKKKKRRAKKAATAKPQASESEPGEESAADQGLHKEVNKAESKKQSKPSKSKARPELEVDPD